MAYPEGAWLEEGWAPRAHTRILMRQSEHLLLYVLPNPAVVYGGPIPGLRRPGTARDAKTAL